MPSKTLFPALFGAALISSSHAALLVHESFSGYTAGSIVGQAATGTGLTGNWETSYSVYHQATASGLTFSGLATSGGALNLSTGTRLSGAFMNFAAVPAGSTIYSSYLINLTALDGAGDSGVVTRINPNSTTQASGYFASFADSRVSDRSSISYNTLYNSNNSVPASSPLALNETFIVISSFSNVGGTGTGDGRLYVLNQSQFLSLRAAGGDIATYLSSATVGTGSNQVWSYAEQLGQTAGTFASGNALHILSLGGSTGRIDEIRYGTGFDDVLPIPEPSIAALGSLGLIAFFRRRR